MIRIKVFIYHSGYTYEPAKEKINESVDTVLLAACKCVYLY